MKICKNCKEEKELTEFYKARGMKDGHTSNCKPCHIADVLSRYEYKGGNKRKEEVTYIAVHKRLQRDRGPAKTHSCVDCGGQAMDWSYNNNGTQKRYTEAYGETREYSLDTNDYDPRCRGCHKAFDAPLRKKVAA